MCNVSMGLSISQSTETFRVKRRDVLGEVGEVGEVGGVGGMG